MSLELELANVYFLKSTEVIDDEDYDPTQEYTPEELEAYPDLVEDNTLVVGSRYIMNEVAVYMEDSDVLATTGIAGQRCVIITTLSRDRCKEIIKKGTEAFERKAKRALDASNEIN